MSRLAALLRLDGAPIAPSLLHRLASAVRYDEADGTQVWNGGPVALVSSRRWATSDEPDPPVARAARRCRIVADARLDNYDDLRTQLDGYLGEASRSPTDAALIGAAYEKWGEACTEHLAGDFAFVVWDEDRRRLFCARDPLGVRQLVYRHEGAAFACASGPAAVHVALERTPERHDPLLQDMLAGRMDRWVHETAYRGLLRLPAGYCLSVDARGVKLSRYYVLGARGPVRLRRVDDYAEALRAHLERAVRVRLRGASPAAVLVSGGLDSSSIACIADRLAAHGHQPARLYSWTFDRTPGADEREYLAAVEEACPRLPLTRVPSDDSWALREFAGDGGYPLDEPETYPQRALFARALRLARRDGCPIVLSGVYGDQLMGGDAYAQPSLLCDVPLRRLRREAMHFRSLKRRSAAWLIPYYWLLRPLVPSPVRRLAGGRKGAGKCLADASAAPQQQPNRLPPPPLATETGRTMYLNLTNGVHAARLAWMATLADHVGLEWRMPFLDLEVVEFALGLPEGLAFRDGQEKRLLRLAMAGVLPELIRQRRTYAHFTALVTSGMAGPGRRRVEEYLTDPLTCRYKMVEYSVVQRAWTTFLEAPDRGPWRPLTLFLAVEDWLRRLEGLSLPAAVSKHAAGGHGSQHQKE